MPRKPDNQRALDMYSGYLQGQTLEEVGKTWGISRQSVYKLFSSRGFQLREKTPQPFIEFQGEKYTLNKYGYYRKTDGNRSRLHRDVWVFHFGEIPDGYDVHHIDEDKANNAIENLHCLPKSDHTKIHIQPSPVEAKHCLSCGKPLVRKMRTNGIETPYAFNKRTYCDPTCKANHLRGKPKGWKPEC